MFNKPTFGANTSSFGTFGTSATPTASPFGGFKPATGTAFGGPPAFGAPAQPSTTGGLFGSSNTTTGGLFGSAQPSAAPAFGASTSGFGFGASTSTGGGLFGASNTSTGLFGQNQNANAFGAKPAGGFGFGSTATTGTTGGLFGSTAQPATTGLFGQQTNTMGGGGLFNSHGAFGQQQAASGTAHAKYNPVIGTDTVVKSGTTQNINIKHHCITCMKEYESKSIEELRFEDYAAGRKGATAGTFGGFQPTAEAKPLFGGSTFGQPAAATTASSVFGGGGLGTNTGFGQPNTFSFGQNAQNTTNTTGLFGAAKPAFGATPSTGTSLFGATTTQAPTFGTTTPSFGFGSTAQNQTSGLFGAKPVTTGFGVTQPTSGFGGFGAGTNLFGAKPAQSTAPAFGTAAPAFGGLNTSGFGASTSTSGSLFGGGAFGKPAASQPAFGFGAPNTGLSTGLGTNTFQTKPAEPAFGGLGGSIFSNQASTNFNSGLGNTSLGGGLFGGNTSLGGSALGGMGALGNNNFTNANLGASAAGNVHEQILNLVARPYGDSPLFKDMVPDTSTTAEDALKPTNPSAVKAVLDGSAYRVTSPTTRLRVNSRPCLTHDKKSLFDGLEESDASLEDKLSLKPSRKRLVLRPKSLIDEHNDHNGTVEHNHRSLEEPPRQTNGPSKDAVDNANQSESENRARKNSFADSNNLENSSDRHGSWLNASKHNWSAEKEKPIDGPTPRIYPSLDKEAPIHISERRASWLTTKALRKPMSSNPEIAENSVRELAVRLERSQDKENIDTFYGPSTSKQANSWDWDNIQRLNQHLYCTCTVSREEENVPVKPREMPPHPTGVKLTRPGYYVVPTLDDMIQHMRPDGSCVVPHLTIGRKNYGNVYYDCEIDVAGLDLDDLVHFLNKEVTIYPDDSNKPPVGQGLNRRAIVTLDRIWPRDKTDKMPITDPERLIAMDYEGKLRRVCDKHDTKFIEYRPQTGSWVFRVEHFSKYSLTDSDEEDEITPDILKRQLVNQQLQKAAVTAPPKPPSTAHPAPGLGGFGSPPKSALNQLPFTPASPVFTSSGAFPGTSGTYPGSAGAYGLPATSFPTPVGTGPGLNMSGGVTFAGINSDLLAMQQTSLSLLHGAGKAFDMDTTEDNGESQSMYQDRDRAFGVKSPTSELARLENRQSHNVQLMKASLYTDNEMVEDDVSMSTGDQMVPRGTPLQLVPSVGAHEALTEQAAIIEDLPLTPVTDEVQMKPLVVRPHTIVLKHHRKVPPYKRTIAGLRDASLLADMSVCRSRHSRVGFGVRGALVLVTSYHSITPLPKENTSDGDINCALANYLTIVSANQTDDWGHKTGACRDGGMSFMLL